MTKEEIQQKSREKSQAIETLCKQLQVVITAEQMITKDGFIKLVVYHNDLEKYDVDEEPYKKEPNEEPTKKAIKKPATDLRK